MAAASPPDHGAGWLAMLLRRCSRALDLFLRRLSPAGRPGGVLPLRGPGFCPHERAQPGAHGRARVGVRGRGAPRAHRRPAPGGAGAQVRGRPRLGACPRVQRDGAHHDTLGAGDRGGDSLPPEASPPLAHPHHRDASALVDAATISRLQGWEVWNGKADGGRTLGGRAWTSTRRSGPPPSSDAAPGEPTCTAWRATPASASRWTAVSGPPLRYSTRPGGRDLPGDGTVVRRFSARDPLAGSMLPSGGTAAELSRTVKRWGQRLDRRLSRAGLPAPPTRVPSRPAVPAVRTMLTVSATAPSGWAGLRPAPFQSEGFATGMRAMGYRPLYLHDGTRSALALVRGRCPASAISRRGPASSWTAPMPASPRPF